MKHEIKGLNPAFIYSKCLTKHILGGQDEIESTRYVGHYLIILVPDPGDE
jgi:hypothetical protein